ncbi:hypothetical protein MGEO_18275 [Marivita geojedonensis]|uniref:Uncharacterized protein n=1 Tax=Marivita geojedonensis TaxID=1123756 RepID=A0A1X4NEG8_9RHOB|nr:hypothetical protein MGEO_18275 [Marivita geojedonensis]
MKTENIRFNGLVLSQEPTLASCRDSPFLMLLHRMMATMFRHLHHLQMMVTMFHHHHLLLLHHRLQMMATMLLRHRMTMSLHPPETAVMMTLRRHLDLYRTTMMVHVVKGH